ncbi:MAG: hypothetical protein R3293_01660 [Candidatus Promineifilaceae bacterium]|nr:hypothetical protein [Candidatus Promineifilaceae bacterium]
MKIINRRRKFIWVVIAAFLVAGIVLIGLVPLTAAGSNASAGMDLSWNSVASGGATISSTSYTLQGTVGQAATGELSSSNHTLFSGYWSDFRSFIFEFFLATVRGT